MQSFSSLQPCLMSRIDVSSCSIPLTFCCNKVSSMASLASSRAEEQHPISEFTRLWLQKTCWLVVTWRDKFVHSISPVSLFKTSGRRSFV